MWPIKKIYSAYKFVSLKVKPKKQKQIQRKQTNNNNKNGSLDLSFISSYKFVSLKVKPKKQKQIQRKQTNNNKKKWKFGSLSVVILLLCILALFKSLIPWHILCILVTLFDKMTYKLNNINLWLHLSNYEARNKQ